MTAIASFSNPARVLAQFGLVAGKKVADFGAGSGFYTLAAAEALAGSGTVYAVDVQKDLLSRLLAEAKRRRIANVEVLWGNVEKAGGSKLRDGAVDAVIAANILFQVEDKEGLVSEIKRVLKPGGEVLVVDWRESFGNMGPEPQAVVTAAAARALFEKGGFVFDRDISAGEHHYGMVFRKVA